MSAIVWQYVDDELLLVVYRRVIEDNLCREFIELVFAEIKRRNLISNKKNCLLIRIK